MSVVRVKVQQDPQIRVETKAVVTVSDGGYERGYAAGYEEGNAEGYTKGHSDGVEQGYVDGADDVARLFVSKTMTTAIFPKDITEIGQYAYYGLPITGELVFPDGVKTVAGNAFNACTKITSLYGANVTATATYTFNGMTSLVSVNFPKLATLSMYCLSDASKLESISMPLCSRLSNGSLRRCYALKILDLPSLNYIEQNALQTASGLVTFILRRNGVCTLQNINALSGTPIANGTGFIYVPAALVEQYKAATNWKTYAAQIRAIEDYPEICGG